ncbi:MAG: hypothetical protein EA370_15315 [Wenzhouxiangella sp.]|nr:MAG: hypothetical protein EA370_15315 [Wenzhouxiangella sp.]
MITFDNDLPFDLRGQLRGTAHEGGPLTEAPDPPTDVGVLRFDAGAIETSWPQPTDELFGDRFEAGP